MSTHRFSQVGFAAMAIGFLWGAYVVVAHLDHVDWRFYAPAFLLCAIGSFMLRHARRSAGAHAEKVESDITTIETSLATLLERVRQMNADAPEGDVYSFSKRIDDECLETINSFVDAREAMIHRFGLAQYAAMMDRFALGERSLNRAWCASADGYIDEVNVCLARAEEHLGAALAVVHANVKSSP
jgi:hypothetical protein